MENYFGIEHNHIMLTPMHKNEKQIHKMINRHCKCSYVLCALISY